MIRVRSTLQHPIVTKLIEDCDLNRLEEKVNSFLSDHPIDVISIRYTPFTSYEPVPDYRSTELRYVSFLCEIIYLKEISK